MPLSSPLPLLLALFVFGEVALAQAVPLVRLSPPDATLREDLVGIPGVRELPDGRVLTIEGVRESRRLVAVDFRRGTVETIGRRGKGPGEYTAVSSMLRLGGDSTLLLDILAGRWHILDGVRIVVTSRPDDRAVLAAKAHPLGADSLGNVLASAGGPPGADSTGRVLVSRASGRQLQVVKLRSTTEPGYPPDPTPRAGGGIAYPNAPWQSYEAAHLFPDGWLAVARVQPYRVDWRSPDGRWIHGAPLGVPIVKVTDREKQAYMLAQAERTGARVRSPAVFPRWPKEVPPFMPGALLGTWDGKLLIQRTPTADQPGMRYDVVDRRGRLERQLVIAPNQRIVGFGARSVYVVELDDNDLERLQRHPWR